MLKIRAIQAVLFLLFAGVTGLSYFYFPPEVDAGITSPRVYVPGGLFLIFIGSLALGRKKKGDNKPGQAS